MSVLNLPGVRAATASYQDMAFQRFSRTQIHASLEITEAWLNELGIDHASSRGNFVFFDTGGSLADFRSAMNEAGFMVGRSYPPYDSWCRVSMGRVEEMQAFAAAARDYFRSGANSG